MYSSLHVTDLADTKTVHHTGSQFYRPTIIGDIPTFNPANYGWYSVCEPRLDERLTFN